MPTIKQQLDIDLKAAMLGGDKAKTETLRGLKSAILYAEVANVSREINGSGGLDDAAVTALLARESKKRQESADLYTKGDAPDRAAKELSEKVIIDGYLPEQISEAQLREIVQATAREQGATSPAQMGQVIGAVKGKVGASADGATIARLVKERLTQ